MRLLKQACVVWLVALILAPFSAPFSVCDVSAFFPDDQPASSPAPQAPGKAAIARVLASQALPATRIAKRGSFADTATARGARSFPPLFSGAGRRCTSSAFLKPPVDLPLRI